METRLLKNFIISIAAFYFCLHRTTNSPSIYDSDSPLDLFQKFSHYNLLSASGLSTKSKNNIFGLKFPPKSPNSSTCINLLLILSGNIELNPGPRHGNTKPKQTFPCGICNKNCTWRQRSVACDGCEVWYHKNCLNMNTAIFQNLQNVSWLCCKCGIPNFNSGIFNQSNSNLNCSNSFELLNSTLEKDPIPISTSTPKLPSKKPKFNGISTMVINFRSLFKKAAGFSNSLHDTGCDVVIGTETWLKPEIQNSELLLSDYDIFRKDRPSRGGGVLIAVKKNLCAEAVSFPSESESVFCKINIKGKKPIIIGSVYRPTDNDIDYAQKVVNDIYGIYNKFKSATLWLGGDFNLPDIDWKKEEIVGSQYPFALNSLFLEMSQDLCLDQINEFPTRGDKILDILFTNRPDIAKSPQLLSGVCDHEAISFKISLTPFRKRPIKREILLWNKADTDNLIKDTESFRSKFLKSFCTECNVSDIWNFIKEEITKLLKKCSFKNNVFKTTSAVDEHKNKMTFVKERKMVFES